MKRRSGATLCTPSELPRRPTTPRRVADTGSRSLGRPGAGQLGTAVGRTTARRLRAGSPRGSARRRSRRRDELHTDRQPVGVHVERHVDRRLPGGVHGTHSATCRMSASGSSGSGSSSPTRTGGSARVGDSRRSQPSAHHCCVALRYSATAAGDLALFCPSALLKSNMPSSIHLMAVGIGQDGRRSPSSASRTPPAPNSPVRPRPRSVRSQPR